MKKFLQCLTGAAMVLALGSFASVEAEAARNVAKYNIQDGLGLKGYDPVAVFPEGGGKAMPGKAELRIDHERVTYFFATPENMKLFAQNPDKYEPTYGGWCAFAMGRKVGEPTKVDIIPTIFTLNGNRAHYFFSNRVKRDFDADVAGFESRADANWKQYSGESPRK